MTFSMNHFGNNGSLGNQMFQYAFLKSMSVKHSVPFCIPPNEIFGKYYYQKLFSNIDECFDFVVCRAVTNMTEFKEWVQEKFNNEHKNTLNNGILYLKGGDLSDELRNISYAQYDISDFFGEQFFETKKVIYIGF